MKNFRFHPEADIELLEQRDYYDLKEPGLGKGFVLLVYKSIADICAMPHAFPKKYGVQHWIVCMIPANSLIRNWKTFRISILEPPEYQNKENYGFCNLLAG